MPEAIRVFIGLGSNLNDPIAQIHRAIDALDQVHDCKIDRVSSLYRNPPMGPQDQPDYVNAVVSLYTELEAKNLLQETQKIEHALQRTRDGEHWGPRTIDLDILLYGDAVIQTENLVVPHYGIAERAFVLVPLNEIEPHIMIPGKGAMSDLLQAVDKSGLDRVA